MWEMDMLIDLIISLCMCISKHHAVCNKYFLKNAIEPGLPDPTKLCLGIMVYHLSHVEGKVQKIQNMTELCRSFLLFICF